jgi:Zn-finger nucleic acid-binding protein
MVPEPPATCPRCRTIALDDQPLVRHCSRCKGSWIAEAPLHSHATAAHSAARGLTWYHVGRAALMCAICAEPMETLVVSDTPVDRCALHGVWFDAGELGHVLAAHAASREPGSTSDAVADVVETGLEVADGVDIIDTGLELTTGADIVETGGGVFEVVVDGVGVVAETVVEIVAAIFSIVDL